MRKSLCELSMLSEANAMAYSAFIDALDPARITRLLARMVNAPAEFSRLRTLIDDLANGWPTRHGDDGVVFGTACRIRDEVAQLLRPAPVGTERADIHG